MKRLLFILLSVALFLPSYGRTSKEYFEAEYGYALIEEDAEELVFRDDDAKRQVIDSCKKEVKKYVYLEVLPALDINSIEYAEALLQLSYFLSAQEKRTTLAQARAIIEAKEGRSERYLKALQNEAKSWNSLYLTEEITPELSDTIHLVCLLYQQLLDVCRNLYRPTDSVYLQFVRELGEWTFFRDHGPLKESEYEGMELAPVNYRSVRILWQDLTRWDSISAEEYKLLLKGKIFPFYVNWFDFGEYGDHLSAVSYFSPLFPADYTDFSRAHAQVAKRVFGSDSPNYLKAADYFLHSLIYIRDTSAIATHITEAHALCEDILKQKQIHQEDPRMYYQWLCNDYQCRLSIEGATKSLEKEMDQTAIAIRKTGDTLLTAHIIELQTRYALLSGDYARAIKLNLEALKDLPALPVMNEDDVIPFYNVFECLRPYYRSLLQAYVFNGEWESAYRYSQAINEGYMLYPTAPFEEMDKNDIAQALDDYGSFYVSAEESVYPYQLRLEELLAQRLYEWCGYVREE